jgi:hypothetical protein
MAANINPIFTLAPVIAIAQITTANTNLDGTGDVVDIITGGQNGTRISKITIKALVTTTAGMVRLFIHDGTSIHLWKEISITAVTKSATVSAFSIETTFLGELAIVLPYNYIIKASTEKSETFNIIIEGGNY